MDNAPNHDRRDETPIVIAFDQPITIRAAVWKCCKCHTELFSADPAFRKRIAQGHTCDINCYRCNATMRVSASKILSASSRTQRDHPNRPVLA